MLNQSLSQNVPKNRDTALEQFINDVGRCDDDTEVKLTCRMWVNMIGPVVMGPIWVLDAKELTRLMWKTHAKLQMAVVRGLIAYLPGPQ